ncbi:MAG: fumarate hydratase C-terminal domain-containing protein [Archaeoglobus sp.]|nr:fumarate hydratase C-terminal domain-containing protein [Archaeoglobus sp.]
MSKEVCIQTPVSFKDISSLEIGDIVYVTGTVYTMRDMGHERALKMLKNREKLPFNLKNMALWHCGPIIRQKNDKWEVVVAGSTSSSRFTQLTAELVELTGLRCVIGKGIMGAEMVNAAKKYGAIYLISTGGAASLYANSIEKVEEVYWIDLGMPEAIWVMRVNRLGPLIVGIDTRGNSLTDRTMKKVATKLDQIARKSGVDLSKTYVWWPRQKTIGSEKFYR